MELLERRGFGKLLHVRTRHGIRAFFFKLHPNCIDDEIGEHFNMLKTVAISIENYTSYFNDTSSLSEEQKNTVRQHHPQAEMIDVLW